MDGDGHFLFFEDNNLAYQHTRLPNLALPPVFFHKRMALCLILFFFFTRCIFSDIIRLNNLIFQVICRFRHLNSNIISFET